MLISFPITSMQSLPGNAVQEQRFVDALRATLAAAAGVFRTNVRLLELQPGESHV